MLCLVKTNWKFQICNLRLFPCNVAKIKRWTAIFRKTRRDRLEDDHLIRQFYFGIKTAFWLSGWRDIRPYTFDEKEKMLFEIFV